MANSGPMWWMRGNTSRPQRPPETVCPPPAPPPVPAPAASLPPPPEPPQQHPAVSAMLQSLTQQLRHADSETLLLIGLLWLLYQDRADSKLLLALAYILL